jgi:hypothetical protein
MRKDIFTFKQTGCILLIFTGLMNCIPDAPHGNPLDPYYDRNLGIDVNGQIFQKSNISTPLDSCTILLIPGNYFTLSDISGRFSFNDIAPGPYQLIISRKYYQEDTTFFHTDSLQTEPLIIYLNGIPFIDRWYFYSQFIDQWWPDPFYAIVMDLIAADPDGINDITEINLSIPEFNMVYPLSASNRVDSFSVRILETDLPDENIFNILGKNVYVELTDHSGSIHKEGPFFIYRIMGTSPIPSTPSGLAMVNSQPFLIWQSYPALFNFHFEIQVFHIMAGIPTLIHYLANLPSTQLEYQYPEVLQSGQYFWVVLVRDELGNMSRSKEASFQVQ